MNLPRSRTLGARAIRSLVAVLATLALAGLVSVDAPSHAGAAIAPRAAVTAPVSPPAPDLGSNVLVFDPSMPTSEIQAAVDAIAAQQVGSEFGDGRYAILFMPGTYGTAEEPLNFQVGYYTTVAGLGQSPTDVVINGSVYVRNQCYDGFCVALNNFWRSLSNLTINVTTPGFGCYEGEFWAVSQAAPMRRVNVTGGNVTLMDYCTGPSYASGGFIADSRFSSVVINGSQQQWLVRNSELASWTNGVWNQVFSGAVNAPPACFPAAASCGGPYTTLPTSPVTREAPYLYVDGAGTPRVFVPSTQRDSAGVTWADGPTPGRSIPLSRFFVASPSDSVGDINAALEDGRHLLLTPGIYELGRALQVKRAGTVVLGIGLPTLIPTQGRAAINVADVPRVTLAAVMIDAGPVNSPVLLRLGPGDARRSDADMPTLLADVFMRIGGRAAGKATQSLIVNSDHVILDNLWAWRADHGNGVGWTINTADTGVLVNGDNVTAYGLFVEHYQKTQAIWRGKNGRVIFFQNEIPYDPPSQEAWMRSPDVKGWPALKVTDSATSFQGTAMGSYSFFNQGVDIYTDNAFEVPTTLPPGSLTNLLTVFLDPGRGKGGILNVVNDVGGPSTIANPSVPVTVVSYP